MKGRRCKYFLWTLFFLFVIPSLASPGDRVLVVSSYNSAFPTYFDQIEGLKSVFDTAGIIFDVESMDSKRFIDEKSFELFYQRIHHKISNCYGYDAVVAIDDNAFNFILEYHDTILPGVPVVFCSVNNREKALGQNENPDVTGIVEAVSMEETIALMLDLFPSEKIHVIVDGTPSGQADLQRLRSLKHKWPEVSFDVIAMHKMFLQDFSLILNKIPANEPVLLLSAYHESTNSMLDFHSSMAVFSSQLSAPLFHLWYHGFNEGVLGGKIISQTEQAHRAALIVSDILSGKAVSEIPVVEQSPNIFVFDQNQLNRFAIDKHDLPENAIILNAVPGFFEKFKKLLAVVIPVFIFLTVVILLLSGNIIRRKRTERELRKQNESYALLNKKYSDQNDALQLAFDQLVVAKDKAEESDRLKTAFLANMSHEIRTPMNGILGFADVLSSPGLSLSRQQEFIDIIKTSGNRMLNTVNDIIDVSRIQAGQISVNKTIYNLINEMNALCSIFKQKADIKGLNLIVENLLPDEGLHFYSDRDKINSIISYIVKNAIKYTQSGSVILSFLKSEDCFIIRVTDTGIGIPADRREAIFESFVQADVEDVKAMEGSGLGLSIAKSYADMLDGKILVESEVNIGSQFTVYLPWEIKTNDQSLDFELSDMNTKKYKILIAEDDEVSYEAFTISLKDYSREFLWAKDGKETVSLAKENRDIDIILMDIKMPLMDGLQATKAIREFNPTVLIIAQTAYALAHDAQKTLDAGCDAYISKPIDYKKLKQIIEQKL